MNKHELFTKFVTFATSIHQLTHELTQNVKSDTITNTQYKILEYISVSGPATPSEISECLYISMSNLSRELKKLSDHHFIVKSIDPTDRRKQSIRLSSDGDLLMNEAFATIEEQFLPRIQHLTEQELYEVEQALELLQNKILKRSANH
ncbi:MarR family winged helix-turn-helix transcriptional regulator [Rummeliibacillus sp. JY-2-4R]